MAHNYTVAEQRAAVQKLVRTSVRREYGALGNRKTDVEFGDVQDAVAGVFILYPNAPFYIVKLGVDVCVERVQNLLETIRDLDDTVRATDRYVVQVERLSSLANARSALGALEGATSERETSLVRIEEVPAYQRFEQSTARFLGDYGKNISSGGNIYQTPQEARGRLAGLVSDSMGQCEEILERVGYLQNAIADFDSMRLPASLSNAVITNSREVMSEWYDELAVLTPERRLALLREVVLDVLAARSTVQGFGALSPTYVFLYFEGDGGPYASSDYPCIPASVKSEIPGPWVVLGDTQLDLLLDGSTSISIDVPLSYVASVGNFLKEPYDIYNVDTPPNQFKNDLITVRRTGLADVNVALSPGTQDAESVAANINSALGGTVSVAFAEPYNIQVRFTGEVALVSPSGSDVEVEKYGPGDWSELGTNPELGDHIFVSGSGVGNNGWYEVTTLNLPTSFTATKLSGVPSAEAQVLAELGVAGRGVRIRYSDAYAATSVANGESIGLVTGDDPVKQQAHNTLGFIRDVSVRSQRTSAQSCVEFINNNPAIAPGGTARVIASRVFEATYYRGVVRTVPTDSLRVVVSGGEYPSVDVTALGGNVAVFSGLPGGAVAVGDIIAVRSSTVSGNINNWGKVTVLGVSVTAVMNTAPVTELGISVEVGQDYRGGALPATLLVQNDPPDVNDGEYDVWGLGGIDGSGPPFELTLSRPLLVHTSLGYQPRTLQVQFGQYHLQLTTQNTLLTSALEVKSTAAGLIFWGALPTSDVGDTVYWSLPAPPKRVEEGDLLELRDTSAQMPTFIAEVVKTQTNPNLLELSDSLEVTRGSYGMEQGASTPSARIRKRKRDNYDILKGSLDMWVSKPLSNVSRYFAELRKFLNPIIVNTNPTASSIKDATDYLADLYVHLENLQGYLSAYVAGRVEQVDRIITTYLQQGSQRAVDILLQARFSDFFGLDQDEVSYAGNLQKAIREVNINDLPQSKMNRLPGGEVIDSYEEVDFEFDTSDTDAEVEIDPPDEVYDYSGRSAF